MDENLSFENHASNIQHKITKILGQVKRFSFVLDSKVKLLIYSTNINSHFNYMASVWSVASKNAIEKPHVTQNPD